MRPPAGVALSGLAPEAMLLRPPKAPGGILPLGYLVRHAREAFRVTCSGDNCKVQGLVTGEPRTLADPVMGVTREDKAPRTLVRWCAWEQAREPELDHLGFAALLGLTRAQAPCPAPAREMRRRKIASVHSSSGK